MTAHASQFVGCGSGVTVAATSTAAWSIPMLQILSASTSVFASFLHDFEHYGLDSGNMVEITQEDPTIIAECIVTLCRDGVASARTGFGTHITVRFEHYTKLIEQCLLGRMRVLDAAQSVSVTAERYGWRPELINFASTRILPNLSLDPSWAFAARRRQGDNFFAAVSAAARGDSPTPVDWSSARPDSLGRLPGQAAIRWSSGASFRHRTGTHRLRSRSDPVTRKSAQATGWGEVAPMRVRLDADGLLESKAICQEEAFLMQREIETEAITRPPSVPSHPRPFTVRASWVEDGEQPPARATHHGDPLAGADIKEITLPSPYRRRLADLIGSAARPGPIMLVGIKDHAEACAEHLRHTGRECTIVEPGYGFGTPWIAPGFLRRPAAGSFLSWLSSGATERLAETGAIVFLHPESAASDLRVLQGTLHPAPPLLVACASASSPSATTFKLLAAAAVESPSLGSTSTYPKISIVTVSYNQAEYLEDCIQSVLAQGYPNLEYIVIDGGSTDGSAAIIERYRPQLAAAVIEPDEGQSDALNKGFQRATGEIMNWLCSDDMLCPGALFRIAEAFVRSPADLVVGGCLRIGPPGASILFQHHSAIPLAEPTPLSFPDLLRFMRSWHRGHYFFQPEAFFSRRIWLESGAFIKRHLYYAMDYDLYLRMAMAGAIAYHVPDMIGVSRAHPMQKTIADKAYLYQTLQLMDEYRDLLSAVYANATCR
ncbi:MAG: glycosyltransferase family 2 protein [Gammaproteobacteria bacterium]